VDLAVDFAVNLLKLAFPNNPIVNAESDWPSNGRTRRSAEASLANQVSFLRRFVDRADREHYIWRSTGRGRGSQTQILASRGELVDQRASDHSNGRPLAGETTERGNAPRFRPLGRQPINRRRELYRLGHLESRPGADFVGRNTICGPSRAYARRPAPSGRDAVGHPWPPAPT